MLTCKGTQAHSISGRMRAMKFSTLRIRRGSGSSQSRNFFVLRRASSARLTFFPISSRFLVSSPHGFGIVVYVSVRCKGYAGPPTGPRKREKRAKDQDPEETEREKGQTDLLRRR